MTAAVRTDVRRSETYGWQGKLVPPPLAFSQPIERHFAAGALYLALLVLQQVFGLNGLERLDPHAAADGRHQAVPLPDGGASRFDGLWRFISFDGELLLVG